MAHNPWFFRIQAFWGTIAVLVIGILSAIILKTVKESGISFPLLMVFGYVAYKAGGIPRQLFTFSRLADAGIRSWLLGPLLSKWYVMGFYALVGILMAGHVMLITEPVHGISIPVTPVGYVIGTVIALGSFGTWLDVRIARLKRSITPSLGPRR